MRSLGGFRSLGGRIFALGAGIAFVGVLLSAVPSVLEVEEALGLGWLFSVRGPKDGPPEAVIVGLSGDSAEAFGLSSDIDEWPRARHAELIDRLAAGAAAAIVLDITFDAPRVDDPEGDARLAEAIERAGNVILAEHVDEELSHPFFVGERRRRPIEPFRRGALATAPFVLPLFPARVSQSWIFGRAADTPSLPSVALHAYAFGAHDRLVALLAGVKPELVPRLDSVSRDAAREEGLQEVMRRLRELFRADPSLGEELRGLAADSSSEDAKSLQALIALYAGGDSRYVNFYGPARTIETVLYHEVLEWNEPTLRERFAGRVVFVGVSEDRRSEQQDVFVSVFSERSGQRLAGVEIGATVFANLLRIESVRALSLPAHWLIVAAWGVLIAALALMLRGFTAVAAGLAAAALFTGAAHYAFQAHAVWMPLAVPLGAQLPAALLIGLSWSYGVLRKQRERIRDALGYYVPAEVVDRLAKETLRPQTSRELVFGTCLVTDAEQYTTLSEALHPTELGELMDAYYDVLVDAVHRNGGVVSDIGGDSMIAVWPAAGAVGSTRLAASRGALDVLAAVDAFNRVKVRRELPTRVGLDSGQLLLGNVGASVRGEYRAVGDIVNTAARLQGLNKLLGTRVLVSAGAADDAPGLVYRPLGDFLLVGKRTPVSVLELQQACGAADPALLELDETFSIALERFTRGDWRRAEASFAAILARFPADRASAYFLAQSRELANRYPSGDWDGVVHVTVK